MKLTAWYAGNQKPVRVGLYQRRYSDGRPYDCYWNGKMWGIGFGNGNGATLALSKRIPSGLQSLPWRGVAK